MSVFKDIAEIEYTTGFDRAEIVEALRRGPLTDDELNEMYDRMLDEVYGDIKICGYEYCASKAFQDVDPIAYNCGQSDFLDSLIGDVLIECKGNFYAKE